MKPNDGLHSRRLEDTDLFESDC